MAGGKKVPLRLIPMHANVLEDYFIVFILTVAAPSLKHLTVFKLVTIFLAQEIIIDIKQ